MHLYAGCNLRCTHCTFWRRPNTLGTPKGWEDLRRSEQQAGYRQMRAQVVAEFAALNPRGVVVSHGGEALLDWDDYLDFCRLCRDHKLKLLSVTNGTPISSLARAELLVLGGPSEITVSFDSIRPETHDAMRGTAGTFAKATSAVVALLRARYKHHGSLRVNAMLLLCRSTYETLDEAYDLALGDLGVDKLKLNVVQPSFGLDTGGDEFFAREHDVDPDRLREILGRVDAKYKLGFNPRWVDQVCMYFRSVGSDPRAGEGWRGDLATSEHVCDSYDRNVWVSREGTMQLCCDSRWAGAAWRESGDLRRFWEGAGQQRRAMATCNRLCGMSHSLRNTSATLGAKQHGR